MGYRGCVDLPDDLPDDLRGFTDYWFSIAPGNGLLPSRADFDLLAVPAIVPRIMIIERIPTESGLRDKYRFVGTRHREQSGRELTGKFFDEVWDERSCEDARRLFAHITETRQPHYWERSVEIDGGFSISFIRVLCPLASDRQSVNMFIGAWIFDDTLGNAAMSGGKFTITKRRK